MGGKPKRAGGNSEPLLVVDVQRGFLNEFTEHLPARIARLAGTHRFDPIYFTRFENPPGGPYRRFLDWHGCEKPPETELAPEVARLAAPERIVSKPGYAGLPDALAGVLRDAEVRRVTVVGIDTDMCVLKVVMDLFDLAIEPIVLVDCCASTAGLQAHLAALAVLTRNIGASRLRDAGLGEGQLAAPTTSAASAGRRRAG